MAYDPYNPVDSLLPGIPPDQADQLQPDIAPPPQTRAAVPPPMPPGGIQPSEAIHGPALAKALAYEPARPLGVPALTDEPAPPPMPPQRETLIPQPSAEQPTAEEALDEAKRDFDAASVGDVAAGWKGGWESAAAFPKYAGAAIAQTFGADETARDLIASAEENERERERYARGRPVDLRDVDSFDNAIDFAQYHAASMLPMFAEMIAGAAIGGLAGAKLGPGAAGTAVAGALGKGAAKSWLKNKVKEQAAKTLTKEIGEKVTKGVALKGAEVTAFRAAREQAEKSVARDIGSKIGAVGVGFQFGVGDVYSETIGEDGLGKPAIAFTVGIPYAALDTLFPLAFVGKAAKGVNPSKQLRLFGKEIQDNIYRRVGREGLKGGALESATEMGQEALVMGSGILADAIDTGELSVDKYTSVEEIMWRLGTAGAAAFVGSAPLGATSGLFPKAPPDPENPKTVDVYNMIEARFPGDIPRGPDGEIDPVQTSIAMASDLVGIRQAYGGRVGDAADAAVADIIAHGGQVAELARKKRIAEGEFQWKRFRTPDAEQMTKENKGLAFAFGSEWIKNYDHLPAESKDQALLDAVQGRREQLLKQIMLDDERPTKLFPRLQGDVGEQQVAEESVQDADENLTAARGQTGVGEIVPMPEKERAADQAYWEEMARGAQNVRKHKDEILTRGRERIAELLRAQGLKRGRARIKKLADEAREAVEIAQDPDLENSLQEALRKAGLMGQEQDRQQRIEEAAQSVQDEQQPGLTAPPTTGKPLKVDDAAEETPAPPEATEPQKEAGNQKMDHEVFNGFRVSIENRRGTERSGKDRTGKEWSRTMPHHYGYLKGTIGPDKDHIDVFLGPDATNPDLPVYVVDQQDPDTGKFDEPKSMMGFASEQEAREGYLAAYEPGWQGFRDVTEMTQDEFKAWSGNPKTSKKPAADWRKKKPAKPTPTLKAPPTEEEVAPPVAATEEAEQQPTLEVEESEPTQEQTSTDETKEPTTTQAETQEGATEAADTPEGDQRGALPVEGVVEGVVKPKQPKKGKAAQEGTNETEQLDEDAASGPTAPEPTETPTPQEPEYRIELAGADGKTPLKRIAAAKAVIKRKGYTDARVVEVDGGFGIEIGGESGTAEEPAAKPVQAETKSALMLPSGDYSPGDTIRGLDGRNWSVTAVAHTGTEATIKTTKGTPFREERVPITPAGETHEPDLSKVPKKPEKAAGQKPLTPNARKKVARLRKGAEVANRQAEEKENPATANQNYTPRRARIMEGMARDAERLREIASVLDGIADDIEARTLSGELSGISSKADVAALRSAYIPTNAKLLNRLSVTGQKSWDALREMLRNRYLEKKPKETSQEKRIRDLTRKAQEVSGFDLFPTPPAVVADMVEQADIPRHAGVRLLEPSAGKGAIADAMREAAPEGVSVDVVEINETLRDLLDAKGHNLVERDFLDYSPGERYDRILMNPPFSKNQDIDHVRHAYGLLKPGGRLISVMSEHGFFASGKKETAFREWIEESDADVTELAPGALADKKQAQRSGVKGRIVVLEKPAEQETQAQPQKTAQPAPTPEENRLAEIRAKVATFWEMDLAPALRDYFIAFDNMGRERLERNRILPEGMTATDWLNAKLEQKSEWDGTRKTRRTGIQSLSDKGLWPTEDGAGEALRKAMLNALKTMRKAPGYSPNNVSALEEKVIGKARKETTAPESKLDLPAAVEEADKYGIPDEDLFRMEDFLPEGKSEWTQKEVRKAVSDLKKDSTKAKRERAKTGVLASNDGSPLGVQVKQEKEDRWGIVIPDASEAGKFRTQRFDKSGFYTHETFDTPEEALESLIADGFTEPAAGTLEGLSETKEWREGMERVAEVQKANIESWERSQARKQAEAEETHTETTGEQEPVTAEKTKEEITEAKATPEQIREYVNARAKELREFASKHKDGWDAGDGFVAFNIPGDGRFKIKSDPDRVDWFVQQVMAATKRKPRPTSEGKPLLPDPGVRGGTVKGFLKKLESTNNPEDYENAIAIREARGLPTDGMEETLKQKREAWENRARDSVGRMIPKDGDTVVGVLGEGVVERRTPKKAKKGSPYLVVRKDDGTLDHAHYRSGIDMVRNWTVEGDDANVGQETKPAPSAPTAEQAAETPAWFADVPDEGLPVQKGDLAGATGAVTNRVARDAYDAATDNQKLNNLALYLHAKDGTETRHGVARLLPDDQKAPEGWKLVSGEAVRLGMMTKEQALSKLHGMLRSARISAWGNEKTEVYNKQTGATRPAKQEPDTPYISAPDLAGHYKATGLTQQRAWDEYVKDTILSKAVRTDQVDAKEFYRFYDETPPGEKPNPKYPATKKPEPPPPHRIRKLLDQIIAPVVSLRKTLDQVRRDNGTRYAAEWWVNNIEQIQGAKKAVQDKLDSITDEKKRVSAQEYVGNNMPALEQTEDEKEFFAPARDMQRTSTESPNDLVRYATGETVEVTPEQRKIIEKQAPPLIKRMLAGEKAPGRIFMDGDTIVLRNAKGGYAEVHPDGTHNRLSPNEAEGMLSKERGGMLKMVAFRAVREPELAAERERSQLAEIERGRVKFYAFKNPSPTETSLVYKHDGEKWYRRSGDDWKRLMTNTRERYHNANWVRQYFNDGRIVETQESLAARAFGPLADAYRTVWHALEQGGDFGRGAAREAKQALYKELVKRFPVEHKHAPLAEKFARDVTGEPFAKVAALEVMGDIADAVGLPKPSTIATEQEQAAGKPDLSVTDTEKPAHHVSAKFLRAKVKAILSDWKGAGRVEVVATQDELPKDALAEFLRVQEGNPNAYVRGAIMKDGTIYLVAENLSGVKEAMQVFLHEVVGHKGVRNVFGGSLDPVLDEIADRYSVEIAKIAKRYGLDLEKTAERREAAEEYLAHLAETHKDPGILKRSYMAIRRFLRSIGVSLRLSDADLDNILMAAKDRAKKGTLTAGRPSNMLSVDSGTDNRGTFDPDNPDIRFSLGGDQEAQTENIRFSIDSGTVPPEQNPATAFGFPTVKKYRDRMWDGFVYNVVNRFKDVYDIVERLPEDSPIRQKAIEALELFNSRARKRIDDLNDFHLRPLWKAMDDAGYSIEQVGEYLHARHARHANEVLRERNPTASEIEGQKTEHQATVDGLNDNEHVQRYRQLVKNLDQAKRDVAHNLGGDEAITEAEREVANAKRHHPEIVEFTDAIAALNALKKIKPFEGDNTALSGMTNADASEILARYQDDSAMRDIAERIDAIQKLKLQKLVSDGLMSQRQVDTWKRTWGSTYVPLHREQEVDEDAELALPTMPKRGQGFYIAGKESHLRAGSDLPVDHKLILPHIVADYEVKGTRGEKNYITNTIAELVRAYPDDDFWQIDKKDYSPTLDAAGNVVRKPYGGPPKYGVGYKVGGEQHYIVFDKKNKRAQRLFEQMSNIAGKEMPNFLRWTQHLMFFLSKVNTMWSPEFVFTNLGRDLGTAGYNLGDTELHGLQVRILKDALTKGIRGMWRNLRHEHDTEWARHADEFERAGGMVGWLDNYDTIQDRLKAIERDMRDVGKGFSAASKLRGFAQIVADANGAIENAVRLSSYVHARGIGMTESQAALLAKNLTVNFNRRGAQSQYLNLAYLFFNASTQGSARMLGAIKRSKKVQAMVGATVAFAVVMDLLNREISGEDDDDRKFYDKIPDSIKERNLIVVTGDGAGDYITIPLPWGYNVFHVIGQTFGRAISASAGANLGDYSVASEAGRLISATAEAFNPIHSASLLQAISPTLLDPAVVIAENKEWHGGPLTPAKNPFGPGKPWSQMYFSSVSQSSKMISETLNSLTGGNKARPGWWDWSPEWIDLGISTAFGSAGRFAINSTDTVARLAGDKDLEGKNIPFWRKVVGREYPSADFELYYARKANIDTLRAELKMYAGKPIAREVRRDHAQEIRMVPRLKATERSIANLRRRQRALELSNAPQKRIDQVREEIRNRMKRFNAVYSTVVL